MQGVRIRRFEPRDVASVSNIEIECFREPWSEEAVEEVARSSYSVIFVLEEEGRVVAYGGMYLIGSEGEFLNVGVLPAFQGKGYGRAIVRALVSHGKSNGATRFLLEVRRSNVKAVSLYESEGFRRIAERARYYADGEDALIYELG